MMANCNASKWNGFPLMAQRSSVVQPNSHSISTKRIDVSLTSSGTGTAEDMRPAERSRKYGILNCTVYMGFHLVFYISVYIK